MHYNCARSVPYPAALVHLNLAPTLPELGPFSHQPCPAMAYVRRILSTFCFKITALAMGIAVLATIGTAVLSLSFSEKELRHTLAREEQALLMSASLQIDFAISARQLLLQSVAEHVRAQGTPLPDIQNILEKHSVLNAQFSDVRLYDKAGELIANQNNRATIGTLNVLHRPYFKNTVSSEQGTVSAPFRSEITGKPIVVITQPIKDRSGKVIGVLSGVLDLQKMPFSEQLDSLHTDIGYLMLLSAEGVIIHHPDRKLILQKASTKLGALSAAVMTDNEGWHDDLTLNAEPVIVSHRQLQSADWKIVTVYPLQKALSPLEHARVRVIFAAAVVATLAGLLAWAITSRLLKPLKTLHEQVAKFQEGEINPIVRADIRVFNTARQDEFGMLSRTLYRIALRREQFEQELQRLATTDPLTGIHNRRSFDTHLGAAIARSSRTDKRLGVALLDIDKFKEINDTLGHGAGDEVLIELCKRLAAAVRQTDVVARLAGDEFVIIFENLAASSEAIRLGEKIGYAMREPFYLSSGPLEVSLSIGIAVTASSNATATDIMRAADAALYRVKESGRKSYAINTVAAL